MALKVANNFSAHVLWSRIQSNGFNAIAMKSGNTDCTCSQKKKKMSVANS